MNLGDVFDMEGREWLELELECELELEWESVLELEMVLECIFVVVCVVELEFVVEDSVPDNFLFELLNVFLIFSTLWLLIIGDWGFEDDEFVEDDDEYRDNINVSSSV